MLTQRQENFCLNIVSGFSQRDAYIQAGYSTNQNHNTIDKHACDLSANAKVAGRIAELRKPAIDSAKMLVAEREERLSEIARANMIELKHAGTEYTAIQELNKMDGSYAPARTDHTFNGEGLSTVLLRLRGYNPKQIEGDGNKD